MSGVIKHILTLTSVEYELWSVAHEMFCFISYWLEILVLAMSSPSHSLLFGQFWLL